MSVVNNDIPLVLAYTGSGGSAAQASALQVNPYGRGIKLFINCSAYTSGSFTVAVQGVLNGLVYSALTSAAISAAGITELTVYPGLTAAANTVANDILPRQWQVTLTPTALVGVVNIGASVIV